MGREVEGERAYVFTEAKELKIARKKRLMDKYFQVAKTSKVFGTEQMSFGFDNWDDW